MLTVHHTLNAVYSEHLIAVDSVLMMGYNNCYNNYDVQWAYELSSLCHS